MFPCKNQSAITSAPMQACACIEIPIVKSPKIEKSNLAPFHSMRIANVPNEFDDVHHHVSFQESGHRYIYRYIHGVKSQHTRKCAENLTTLLDPCYQVTEASGSTDLETTPLNLITRSCCLEPSCLVNTGADLMSRTSASTTNFIEAALACSKN